MEPGTEAHKPCGAVVQLLRQVFAGAVCSAMVCLVMFALGRFTFDQTGLDRVDLAGLRRPVPLRRIDQPLSGGDVSLPARPLHP